MIRIPAGQAADGWDRRKYNNDKTGRGMAWRPLSNEAEPT